MISRRPSLRETHVAEDIWIGGAGNRDGWNADRKRCGHSRRSSSYAIRRAIRNCRSGPG